MNLEGLDIGSRVEMHPCTDWWMQGDRFGYVVKIDAHTGAIHVRLDKSNRLVTVRPDIITPVGRRR